MAVTLRSGKGLEEGINEKKKTEEEKHTKIREEIKHNGSEVTEEERTVKVQQNQPVEEGDLRKKEEVQAYKPQVLFPQRLQKAKLEEKFSKFLNMFKKIEITLPFSEALTQMPHYAKFMKDILRKKKKIVKEGVVNLTATCSAVIQRSLTIKMQDPSSFTIPCTIGNSEMGKALCDSKASINLMPLSMVKRLSLGELTLTNMTL